MLEKLARDVLLHLIHFPLVVTKEKQAWDRAQKQIESLSLAKEKHDRNFKE